MINDYSGKRAVVTGAASGIGLKLAVGMAKRGADVLITDIRGDALAPVADEIKALGRKAYCVQADVSLVEDCKKIFDATMENLGGCDILVNNAGVTAFGEAWDIPDADLKWVTEVNYYSHWYMMREFIPQMKEQGNKCQILNVCSIAGLITMASAPVYFSTKHAAVALSEVVYKEFKRDGVNIDVSIFCPGFIQTNLWKTDDYRPERFAIDPGNPYYTDPKYQGFVEFNKKILTEGAPLDETIEYVFEQLGKDQFYILTHDQYDKLLREQGNFQADKVRPVELALIQ